MVLKGLVGQSPTGFLELSNYYIESRFGIFEVEPSGFFG